MIPQIPTDNLYKFLALTGIVGLGATLFVLPLTLDNQLVEKTYETERQSARILGEIQWIENRMDLVERLLKEEKGESSDATDPDTTTDLFKNYIEYDNDDIKVMFIEAKEKVLSFDTLKAEQRILQSQIGYLTNQKKKLYTVKIIADSIFILMIIFGFWNWYRIQKLQDAKY